MLINVKSKVDFFLQMITHILDKEAGSRFLMWTISWEMYIQVQVCVRTSVVFVRLILCYSPSRIVVVLLLHKVGFSYY